MCFSLSQKLQLLRLMGNAADDFQMVEEALEGGCHYVVQVE